MGMTNSEKFEEVFGIKIDLYHDPCGIVDSKTCIDASDCHNCPGFKFWEKPYRKKKNKTDSIYVVSYIMGEEPVITVFDNEVVAKDCYNYFKKYHHACHLYKCPIYSTFKVTGIVAEGGKE